MYTNREELKLPYLLNNLKDHVPIGVTVALPLLLYMANNPARSTASYFTWIYFSVSCFLPAFLSENIDSMFPQLLPLNCMYVLFLHQHHLKWSVTACQFCIERKNQKQLQQWVDTWSFGCLWKVDRSRVVVLLCCPIKAKQCCEEICWTRGYVACTLYFRIHCNLLK